MNGLLKFITCGSVDDGKSTLIGHILYDSKLLYADQEKALELDSKVGSRGGAIDYSLLLDGLMAEREQGITIDVAYRYFTTDNRSFIVADTPGHEEYTRNMAVGAFTFGIMGISKGFVPWFFGNDFYKVIPNLIIISPIIIIIGISNVLGTQYLLAIGRQKEYTISIIIAALINFVCNFLLIGNYLSSGAAIATVLAEGAALLTQVYFLKNEFDFFYVLKMAIKYICFGLIMMLVVVCVGNLLPTSIVSTFFQIVVGGIVYLVLLFVTRDSILKFIYDSFLNRKKSN